MNTFFHYANWNGNNIFLAMGTSECGQAEAVTKTGSNIIIIKDNTFSFIHGTGQQFLQAATIHNISTEPPENMVFLVLCICLHIFLYVPNTVFEPFWFQPH